MCELMVRVVKSSEDGKVVVYLASRGPIFTTMCELMVRVVKSSEDGKVVVYLLAGDPSSQQWVSSW